MSPEVPPTTRITRIAAGGDGVGRLPDGRTVFVPRTAPGDLVELARVRLHKRFARAWAGRVLEPAPERVVPRCPHYEVDQCGGCQLQHLSAPAQLEAKRRSVGDALRRIARLELEDPEIEPSDVRWEYRTKLTLAVAGGGRRIGLRRYERPDEVFELDYCHITVRPLNALWRAVSGARRLLPREAERLILRSDRGGGVHLVVVVAGTTAWGGAGELHRRVGEQGVSATIWWQPEGGAARVVAGGDEGAYPATVFEQVHPGLGDRIRDHAVAQVGDARGRHVWDLYAGIGETTDRLLAAGATVESVESDARAVSVAERRGPPSRPAGPVERHAGRAEELVGALRPPAAVVTNPPRVGMDPRVCDALRAARPARIVYVSCDPATLARDVARLGPEVRVVSVRAFDLFPQTAHVETVAVLEGR